MTNHDWDYNTADHLRAHTAEAVRSGNKLLDRARRAEWSANFRAMFARLAALAPLMWTHHKRGTLYALVGVAKVQAARPIVEGDMLTIYMGQDGFLHARLADEFDDGRFSFVPGPRQPNAGVVPRDFTNYRAEKATGKRN